MFSLARSRIVSLPEVRLIGQVLPYPITPCPPIAVFSPHFTVALPAVSLNDPQQLTTANVRTAAAPMSIFRTIDGNLWRPEDALIVLSQLDRDLMTEQDRDYLWEKFGVPAFEYLLDPAGRLMARECEAHEGLHLERQFALNTSARVINDPCPCGKSTPRLLHTDAIIEEAVLVGTLTQEWRNWQTHQT